MHTLPLAVTLPSVVTKTTMQPLQETYPLFTYEVTVTAKPFFNEWGHTVSAVTLGDAYGDARVAAYIHATREENGHGCPRNNVFAACAAATVTLEDVRCAVTPHTLLAAHGVGYENMLGAETLHTYVLRVLPKPCKPTPFSALTHPQKMLYVYTLETNGNYEALWHLGAPGVDRP